MLKKKTCNSLCTFSDHGDDIESVIFINKYDPIWHCIIISLFTSRKYWYTLVKSQIHSTLLTGCKLYLSTWVLQIWISLFSWVNQLSVPLTPGAGDWVQVLYMRSKCYKFKLFLVCSRFFPHLGRVNGGVCEVFDRNGAESGNEKKK